MIFGEDAAECFISDHILSTDFSIKYVFYYLWNVNCSAAFSFFILVCLDFHTKNTATYTHV